MRRNTQTRLQKLALAKCQTNRDLSFNAAYEEAKKTHEEELCYPTENHMRTLMIASHCWEQSRNRARESDSSAVIPAEANSKLLGELFRISDTLKRMTKKVEKLENEPED